MYKMIVVENTKLTDNEEDVIDLMKDAYTIANENTEDNIDGMIVDSITFRSGAVSIALRDDKPHETKGTSTDTEVS